MNNVPNWQLWLLARVPRPVVVGVVMVYNLFKDAELDAYEVWLLLIFSSMGLGGIGGVVIGSAKFGFWYAGEHGLIAIFLTAMLWGVCFVAVSIKQLVFTLWRGIRREWQRANTELPKREKKADDHDR